MYLVTTSYLHATSSFDGDVVPIAIISPDFRLDKMPKTSDQMVTTTRRRSVRQKPVKKEAPKVASPRDSDDDEVRMPPGYNPSDDSEEEYVPPVKKAKVSLTRSKRSRKQTSGSDSEPEEEENQKSKKKSRARTAVKKNVKEIGGGNIQPPSKTKSVKTVSEIVTSSPSPVTKIPDTGTAKPKDEKEIKKEPEQNIMCPFKRCSEKLKIDGNARFHLSLHYYDAGKFSESNILTPEDPDENGKAKDEKGKVIRYRCHYDKCTQRRMGYKV